MIIPRLPQYAERSKYARKEREREAATVKKIKLYFLFVCFVFLCIVNLTALGLLLTNDPFLFDINQQQYRR